MRVFAISSDGYTESIIQGCVVNTDEGAERVIGDDIKDRGEIIVRGSTKCNFLALKVYFDYIDICGDVESATWELIPFNLIAI